jgi:membrane fusion protein (multidrug efflux system)
MRASGRTLAGLIVLAAAIAAVIFLWKTAGPKAGEEGEEITPDMAVHVGKISRATLHRFVTAYGVVEPEPAGVGRRPADSEVASPVAGIVSEVDCAEGRQVARGATLFRLDDRVARVTYEKAKKALSFAEETFERQKKLLPVEGTSRKSYLEAEGLLNAARSDLAAAETDLALLQIKAPLSGTVVKVNAEPGEAVELNTVLAKIVDLGRLVASVNVPSREAELLKAGQPAYLETGGTYTGAVVYIGRQIDDKTDTVPVRISIPTGSGFSPGQFLSVRIVCEEHAECLAVPEAAVVADSVASDTGSLVLVEGDNAVRKPIKIGLRESGLVEVEGEGLKEGTVIVTEDAYAVPGETKIHIVK